MLFGREKKTTDVRQLAEDEAERWEDSNYYADAEKWTWLFWSDEQLFLPYFRQLDLTYVIELACGHGRHGERLVETFEGQLGRLLMTDILKSNVDHCRTRLGRHSNVSYFVANGNDFRPVPDSTATAIFCYDAMVHFHRKVVLSYLHDTRRVLVPGGRALFHHSNYAFDPDVDFGQNPHARAFMSAGLFAKYAESAGLQVVRQTAMTWGGSSEEIDCLSLVERPL